MQWMGSMEQDGVFTEVEMGSKCALLWSMLSRPGSRTGLRGRLVDAGSIGGERDGFMERCHHLTRPPHADAGARLASVRDVRPPEVRNLAGWRVADDDLRAWADRDKCFDV